MFHEMFLFEWRYFTRQPAFYITTLIFFGLAFLAPNGGMSSLGPVAKNSAYAIAFTMNFLSVFSMFLVVNFVANAAIRERTSAMAEILYCKPFNPALYQLGRFLGSFVVVVVVFAFVPIGYLLGCMMPWIEQTRIGPTQLSSYFTTFFYISVPTLFALSSIFYSIAVRTKSMMMVYISVVALFILNELSESLVKIPELKFISAFFDPFALNTFGEITQYWTILEKNVKTLSFSGLLMTNRLVWIGIGIFMVTVFGGFTRPLTLKKMKPAKNKKLREIESLEIQAVKLDSNALYHQGIQYKGEVNSDWQKFLARTLFEVKQVIFDRAFFMLCILSLILLLSVMFVPQGFFGNHYWPVTERMVMLIRGGLSILSLIVITYYSAELIWRQRESGMGDIVDCSPVANMSFWLSKLVALWSVLLILLLLSITFVMIFQLAYGYTQLDVTQYLVSLFYFSALPWMMLSVLAFLLQVLSPNKYVGMFAFVLFILSRFVMEPLGLGHNMFRFSESPEFSYSDMNGYGQSLLSHSWYMVYWGALSLVMSIVGYGLWQRGPGQSLKIRIKNFNYQIGQKGKKLLTACIALFLLSGGVIYYNTQILNDYHSVDSLLQIHADYEKQYAQYAGDPVPSMTKLNAKVDIYPTEQKVDIDASVLFENKTNLPIRRFLVSISGYSPLFAAVPGYSPVDFNVEITGGKMGPVDGNLNTHWFEFEQPLQPGENRSGRYTVRIEHKGFSERVDNIRLLENGTFIQNSEVFPRFGYIPFEALISPKQREKRGLPVAPRQHKLEDSRYYDQSVGEVMLGSNSGYMEFETTVSTSLDQTAIAPGYLQKKWSKDSRNYFHYKMDAPISNYFAYFSGRYEVLQNTRNGIEFSVYYHKAHDMNVQRIQQSMQDAIEHYSEVFGPYQHKQARVIEFPGPKNFGQDFPNTIAYSENAGFIHNLTDPKENDQVYWFIAHEVAHQWWGAQIDGANVQGGTMLVETLAQYSAFSMVKKKYGVGALRRMLKFEMNRYFTGRAHEIIEEMPLMKVENQPYIHYNKGSIVMMSVANLLGEQRLNLALKSFLEEFKFSQTLLPTTIDLLRHINKDTSTDEKTMIQNLFATISIYDLKLSDVVVNEVTRNAASETENSLYEVTLTIDAQQFVADGQGVETEVEFSQWIDVGLFIKSPDDLREKSEALYLQKSLIKTGKNIISIFVTSKPNFAAIDPFIHVIDRDLENNMIKLSTGDL